MECTLLQYFESYHAMLPNLFKYFSNACHQQVSGLWLRSLVVTTIALPTHANNKTVRCSNSRYSPRPRGRRLLRGGTKQTRHELKPRKIKNKAEKAPGNWVSSDHFRQQILDPDWAQKIICIFVCNPRSRAKHYLYMPLELPHVQVLLKSL